MRRHDAGGPSEPLLALLNQQSVCHIAATMPDGSLQLPTWVDTDGDHNLINAVQRHDVFGHHKHRHPIIDPIRHVTIEAAVRPDWEMLVARAGNTLFSATYLLVALPLPGHDTPRRQTARPVRCRSSAGCAISSQCSGRPPMVASRSTRLPCLPPAKPLTGRVSRRPAFPSRRATAAQGGHRYPPLTQFMIHRRRYGSAPADTNHSETAEHPRSTTVPPCGRNTALHGTQIRPRSAFPLVTALIMLCARRDSNP